MSSLPRTTCIVCARDVATRVNGNPREHLDGDGGKCHGSRTPAPSGDIYVFPTRSELITDADGQLERIAYAWGARCHYCAFFITCDDDHGAFERLTFLSRVHRCTDLEEDR